ncbi:hypothetical protein A3850_007110 [Lewinella sp. 4G2]|nr:hypothetical protein A3850_007110 [Lewinella sp. 4G2]
MLFVGEETFGDFASYNGPETSRLNFRVATSNEVVYFGFGRGFKADGTQETLGQYRFRVRSAATGETVFGPFTINSNTENLLNLSQAAAGPQDLNPGGYAMTDYSTFTPAKAGEYYVEFDQTRNRPRYIGLWDITIANNGNVQTGRVYSKNWAFRVPEVKPVQPYCSFGAELSTEFYSYTSGGFVTRIDFTDSGFQPLSFNLAFNRKGPGTTGDLIEDRKSVPFINATDDAAEHLIFLEEPDIALFPDGECGQATTTGRLQCAGDDQLCIPVTLSMPGQLDILLDFNQNGIFDEDMDRFLVYASGPDGPLEDCVPWDGLMGNGNPVPDGALFDIQLRFAQGVQHWSLYDGELMRNGFCLEPIRPACSVSSDTPIYYDDENIVEDPGTGGTKVELNGCQCRTDDCRTWTNFEANASDDCIIIDSETTGYGDRNTLNTWWFAYAFNTSELDVPFSIVTIDGPDDICPGAEAELEISVSSSNTVESISWTGPNGPLPQFAGEFSIVVTDLGAYSVTVTDIAGCTSSSTYVLRTVDCSLDATVTSVTCNDNGTDTDMSDDTFTASVLVTGDNSAGFTYAGNEYAYGDVIELGPFLISNGDLELTFTDLFYDCCEETVTVVAPPPCSDGCAITSVNIISVDCFDEGTSTDPTDDSFTFTMVVTGINGGDSWVDEASGLTGEYGVTNTFGPFLISDGDLNFYFQDVTDPDCAIAATVQAPPTCSDECILTPVATNITCFNNGTPFDSSDDLYTFDLQVTSINSPSVAYSVDGMGAYLYGAVNTIGPLRITGDDFTYQITDLGGPGCFTSFTLPESPATCSNECAIAIDDVILTCRDDEESFSGQLQIEVLVTNANPGSAEWVSSTGVSGAYGVYVPIGQLNQGGASLNFTINEAGRPTCSASGAITSPEVTFECPQPISSTGFPMSVQTFGAAAGAGEEGTCYLGEEVDGGNRRTSRLTLESAALNQNGSEVITLYLYGESGQDFTAAAFAQQAEATLTCDLLASVLATSGSPTTGFVPALPTELVPAGLVAYGHLTVALQPGEVFSLVTSTTASGNDAAFTYVAVLAQGGALRVRSANGSPLETTTAEAEFNFLTSADQINLWFGSRSSADSLGLPTVANLCGTGEFLIRDTLLGTCASAQMIRRFDLAIGDTVLTDVCEQVFSINVLRPEDVIWPRANYRFRCDEDYLALDNGAPSPDVMGYPIVYRDGRPVLLTGDQVNELSVTFGDTISTNEAGETVVVRRWRVTGECSDDEAVFTQTFILQGEGQAFFTCPISNHYCPIVDEDIMVWPMDEHACTATIELPEVELNGLCDTMGWTFTTEVLRITETGDSILFLTLIDGDDRTITDLPAGDYLLYFTGEHPTETIEGRYCRFRVADLENPIAVCRGNLTVSIAGNGQVWISTQMIDLGSYDNCALGEIGIRRVDGDSVLLPYTPTLTFNCEDAGEFTTVAMQVTDAVGNENFCTTIVEVVDQTDPYCTGLDDVTISCADLPDGFDATDTLQLANLFGVPDVIDNCAAFSTELTPIIAGDACNPEVIRRSFRARDQNGNLSRNLFFQDITVVPSLDYVIVMPEDVITDCAADAKAPDVLGDACDSITVTFVDEELTPGQDDCRFLSRTYTITSWCEWDGTSPATVIARDENCSVVAGSAPIYLIRTPDAAYVDVDTSMMNGLPAAGTCGDNPAGYLRSLSVNLTGRYTYTQLIRVQDDVAPELAVVVPDTICAQATNCESTFTIGFEAVNACAGEGGNISLAIDLMGDGSTDGNAEDFGTLTGTYPSFAYETTLPLGSHQLTVMLTDACGNVATETREVAVQDCNAPSFTAREDRAYVLDLLPENGGVASVQVSAIDLVLRGESTCNDDLTYSVNRKGETPDPELVDIYLNCDDRYRIELEVYAWDGADNPLAVQPDGTVGGQNWEVRTVPVRVTDPNQVCQDCQVGTNITLNGRIVTRTGVAMELVTVERGDGVSSVTSRFGTYQLAGELNKDYTLSATLPAADRREGLSTIDMLILRSHILGIHAMTDPLQLLAADVNQDGLINLQDMMLLQGLIIGNERFYPATNPWVFVAADWSGQGKPSQEISILNPTACSDGHDFIGVRLGDLNASVTLPSSSTGNANVATAAVAADPGNHAE